MLEAVTVLAWGHTSADDSTTNVAPYAPFPPIKSFDSTTLFCRPIASNRAAVMASAACTHHGLGRDPHSPSKSVVCHRVFGQVVSRLLKCQASRSCYRAHTIYGVIVSAYALAALATDQWSARTHESKQR